MEKFRDRAPDGVVLVPNDETIRPYGQTPYVRMDRQRLPRDRFGFGLPREVEPVARVVVVGEEAWLLDLLQEAGRVESGDLVLTWEPGQNSIHDRQRISESRDVGNVIVQRRTAAGGLEDAPYDVSFAFAFSAFVPEGTLHLE